MLRRGNDMDYTEKTKIGTCGICGNDVEIYTVYAGDPDWNRGECRWCEAVPCRVQPNPVLEMEEKQTICDDYT